MLRMRLLIFVLLFAVFSVSGITLAKWRLESKQNAAQEEVEGLQDISGYPRVVNMPPVSVLVADRYEYILSIVDSDSPLSEIYLTIESSPDWIKSEGFRIYGTPTAQDIGTFQVIYTLSDGSNTITNQFYIVVTTDE